jgi:pimeloyl-ACP methyl ester carboxylesterase
VSFDLGFVTLGRGPRRVLVLHDWLGDRRNWDPLLPYLDVERFTYAFLDLRGYGGSRHVPGDFTCREAASDALALAKHLGWERFSAIGHSMSGLIVQQLAALAPVERLVVITPVGPAGLAMPEPVLAAMEKVALDPSLRRSALEQSWGDRLGATWLDWKVARWIECSEPRAVLGYLRMFATTDLRDVVKRLDVPILVVAGEHDAPWFQADAMRAAFASYPRAEVVSCANAGHYPMQETPPFLATTIERFLSR